MQVRIYIGMIFGDKWEAHEQNTRSRSELRNGTKILLKVFLETWLQLDK